MKKSLFITGTDTGVGKTFVACALARGFKAQGMKVGVMKPVETGCRGRNGGLIPEDARKLREAAGSEDPIDTINPYRFSPPLAPSLAAREAGVTIELQRIKRSYEELSEKNDVVIVEGAGGLMVPLTDSKTFADLVLFLGLPMVVVAPNRLGVINHTLLTVRCAEAAGIEVRGAVLNNLSVETDESAPHNAGELKRLGITVIKTLPFSKEGEGSDLFRELIEFIL